MIGVAYNCIIKFNHKIFLVFVRAVSFPAASLVPEAVGFIGAAQRGNHSNYLGGRFVSAVALIVCGISAHFLKSGDNRLYIFEQISIQTSHHLSPPPICIFSDGFLALGVPFLKRRC